MLRDSGSTCVDFSFYLFKGDFVKYSIFSMTFKYQGKENELLLIWRLSMQNIYKRYDIELRFDKKKHS